jgi:hypothetical protein
MPKAGDLPANRRTGRTACGSSLSTPPRAKLILVPARAERGRVLAPSRCWASTREPAVASLSVVQAAPRGLLGRQDRGVMELPSESLLEPLSGPLRPQVVRVCLHQPESHLGKPFGLTTPGGQPVPLLDELRFPRAFPCPFVRAVWHPEFVHPAMNSEYPAMDTAGYFAFLGVAQFPAPGAIPRTTHQGTPLHSRVIQATRSASRAPRRGPHP